jgi:hypothetical protein
MVIYDARTGRLVGVLVHPDMYDRNFEAATYHDYNPRWYWHWGLQEWVLNGAQGQLFHFDWHG